MKDNIKVVIKYLILLISVVCIVIGICSGNFAECMYKGMGICWECIGLG